MISVSKPQTNFVHIGKTGDMSLNRLNRIVHLNCEWIPREDKTRKACSRSVVLLSGVAKRMNYSVESDRNNLKYMYFCGQFEIPSIALSLPWTIGLTRLKQLLVLGQIFYQWCGFRTMPDLVIASLANNTKVSQNDIIQIPPRMEK